MTNPNISNSQGKIYYGMHFYPGVAEYQEPGKEANRVFLNEDTIRSMDPTFAARPIFVEHVDEVDPNLDQLRKEADGWVVESFYNSADGKHWVKFIVVSERGQQAIQKGMRLSNAYVPTSFGSGGLWNGVQYDKEITGGKYEHLAIVQHPRYEESVIMSPDEFKSYNEKKIAELKRLSNSKEREGEESMKLNFFKKTKVENAVDIESLSVLLPKTGKEVSISKLINDADEMEDKAKKNEVMADMSHQVKMHDGSMCNVGDLLEKHKALQDEMAELKKEKQDEIEPEHDVEEKDVGVESKSVKSNDESDEDAKKKALQLAEHEEKEIEEAKKKNELEEKKRLAREKADRLRNAHLKATDSSTYKVEMMEDQVLRGKARYGK